MLKNLIFKIQIKKLAKHFIWLMLLSALFYTRFYNLGWGMPYPMHPDERNMMIAIVHFNCFENLNFSCLNPDFFAYGQTSLYLAYFLTIVGNWVLKTVSQNYNLITISLRLISASASIGTFFLTAKIVRMFFPKNFIPQLTIALLVIFTPVLIQFAHFGTTESLLIFLITALIYISNLYIDGKISNKKYIILSGLGLGLSVATKISGISFAIIPFLTFLFSLKKGFFVESFLKQSMVLVKIAIFSIVMAIVFSPFNLLDFPAFLGSMNYESSVGIGLYKAFYTKQFEYSLPFIFPLLKIFPYSLGLPAFLLFIFGFLFLPYRKKENIIRLSFLILFIPSAYLYAKWTRFFAPTFPLALIIAGLFLSNFYLFILNNLRFLNKFLKYFIILIILVVISVPGIAFMSIYNSSDVRFQASKWIYENIPARSIILSETANVVDIPMENDLVDDQLVYEKSLSPISFDFYEADNSSDIEKKLAINLEVADYIFVPSRRIFENHSCVPISNFKLQILNFTLNTKDFNFPISAYKKDRCQKLREKYPVLDAYYSDLFSGKLGFEKVAEFTSFPKIKLFGKTFAEFPDENSEETSTVFDHPVVRIYKKI